MKKRTAFTVLIISFLFLIFFTMFNNSAMLTGLAIRSNFNYDNFAFAMFILSLGILIAMGYYLMKLRN